MTKKEIKILAADSFTKGILDPKKVKRFSGKMKRRELRQYIKYIKLLDSKSKVVIEVPDVKNLDKNSFKRISASFKNKRFVVKENPSLILGVRLTDYDLIHDYNLKNNLEDIVEQI